MPEDRCWLFVAFSDHRIEKFIVYIGSEAIDLEHSIRYN